MSKQPEVYLELALRAPERVPRFLADRTLNAYLEDELCQSAVERQLEIAGDALGQLRKLDPELFAGIPEGPLIVAFRMCWRMATRQLITGGFSMPPRAKCRPSRRSSPSC